MHHETVEQYAELGFNNIMMCQFYIAVSMTQCILYSYKKHEQRLLYNLHLLWCSIQVLRVWSRMVMPSPKGSFTIIIIIDIYESVQRVRFSMTHSPYPKEYSKMLIFFQSHITIR